ncbi:Bacterial extracellular solute-binding protein, family 3 [compost metagenome]
MRVLTLALLLLATLAQAEPRVLRFSVVDSWAMPLARIEEGRLTGGILFEFFTGTAQRVGLKPDFRILPRARVEQALLRHDIDVRCYVAPEWVEHQFQDYRWSAPLMVQRDLLVGRGLMPARIEQLTGEPVGTVLGYRYPRLRPLLQSGRLVRDEARNQELVLKKLLAGRYRYAISSEIALDWFNRELPEARRLQPVDVIEETALGCLVLDSPELPTQSILDALAAMKDSGEIERILQHYR